MILPYVAIVLLVLTTTYSAVVSFGRKPDGRAPSWIFPAGVTRASRIFAGIVTLAIIVGLVAWLSVSARNSTRRSSRFLIPEGYTGWVRVEFEVQGAPPLPVEAGQNVLRIPPNGSLRTSSPEQYGWARDTYSSAGLRQLPDSAPQSLIWGKINGETSGSSSQQKYEEFFVGTSQVQRTSKEFDVRRSLASPTW